MRRLIFGIVIANLVAILVLVFVYPGSMVAPGPVSPAHRAVGEDCFACHTLLRGAAAGKCVACHEPSRIGLFTVNGSPIPNVSAGFHQHLIETDCMACHTEHAGSAVVHPIPEFDHGLLSQDARDQCANCHTAPGDPFHRSFSGECGTCHSQKAWKPASFDHDGYFLLDRDHAAPCATCHVQSNYSTYTCYGCHEHTSERIRAEHIEEGILDFRNCVQCHRSAHEREGAPEHEGDED